MPTREELMLLLDIAGVVLVLTVGALALAAGLVAAARWLFGEEDTRG